MLLLRMVCTDRSLEKGPGYLEHGKCYRLGRSSACAFVINDLSVSRRHAEFTVKDGSILLNDLDSRNGTFIDGVRERIEHAELTPGQTVRFGWVVFQLVGHETPQDDEPEMSEASTFIVHLKPTAQPNALEHLSQAERSVFDHLLTGLGEKEVATVLNLSQHTIHNHTKAIYKKLGVNSRPELLAMFLPDRTKPKEPPR
ncbi:MAG: FHA domain-containing protein [Gemmataceae bacterium]|nr:FHA domain-containing protein [Gemmataceae bacterium]